MANEQFLKKGAPAGIASSQSVDFDAMVAGVVTADVTVQGAAVGSPVLVSKPSDSVITNDVTLQGFVAAANTVTIVAISNDNTAVTNFGAVTLTVVVFD